MRIRWFSRPNATLVQVNITAVCKNNGTRIKIETYYDVAGLRKITPIGDLVESSPALPLLLQ